MSGPSPTSPPEREASGVHHPELLRADAEARLADAAPVASSPSAEELLHELQVHQIELEMQNEALRQAQIALEESRDRYLDLYEFAPVGYLTLTRTGQIAAINLTGTALLGGERSRWLHHRFDACVVAEDQVLWRQLFIRALGDGMRQQAELRLQRSDGQPFTAHLDVLGVKQDGGEPGVRLTLSDISGLRSVERDLAESKERYRLIFENSKEAILFGHPDGSITAFANPAACALFGYSPQEMHRLSRHMIMDVSDPRLAEALEERRRHGVFSGELRCVRRDGSIFPAEVTSTLFQDAQGVPCTSILIRDITERKQAETALAEREALLRVIAENLPDAVYVLDRGHRLRYLNPVALSLVQTIRGRPELPLEELLGLDAAGVFGDSDLARAFRDLDEQAMAEGQVRKDEDVVALGSLELSRLTVRAPLFDGAGQVVGLVGMAHDITDDKQAEAERLEIMKRQRDALVREVHHRIKNSLQSVAGLLQRELGRFLELDPRLETAITQVQAIAVTHGLQAASPQESIRFCDVAAQICLNVESQTLKTISWFIDEAASEFKPVQICRDESVAVALVVNELVLNAVKHSSPGAPPVRVFLGSDGQRAKLHIHNALGSTPAFDLASGKGLGTGLSLVQALLPICGAELGYALEDDGVLRTELILSEPVVLPLAP